MNYDVAVLLLEDGDEESGSLDEEEPVYIRSICLPDSSEPMDEKQICHVAGRYSNHLPLHLNTYVTR